MTARCAALLAGLLLAAPLLAERADRDKPTQIEADRLSADDARRVTVFEGHVVLTKGTLSVRAERIVVRQDAEGYQHATATGHPVRFRQRGDARDGQPGVWAEAQAERIEIDDRAQTVELHGDARVARGEDEVRGDVIVLDQRTEIYSARAAKDATAPAGRVRAVIQPRTPREPAGAGAGAPAERPPAR
jgi:lipopolysaccharide export system protein LptA